MKDKKLLSVSEFAAQYKRKGRTGRASTKEGITVGMVYKMIEKGQLKCTILGGMKFVEVE